MDKLLKGSAVAIVAFAIVLAIFVGARVDQFTMSMLGGAFLGLLIAVPTTLMATLFVTRGRDSRPQDRNWHYTSPLPPSPPQYWTLPNQGAPQTQAQAMNPQLTNPNLVWNMQNAAVAAPANDPLAHLTRRRFVLIGEAGEVQEISAPVAPEPEYTVVNPHTLGAARL
jgi:hypothetical protein